MGAPKLVLTVIMAGCLTRGACGSEGEGPDLTVPTSVTLPERTTTVPPETGSSQPSTTETPSTETPTTRTPITQPPSTETPTTETPTTEAVATGPRSRRTTPRRGGPGSWPVSC